jgi:rSAM-associated Gly-rich repeat protein
MAKDRRTLRALAALLPAGVVGLSMSLAAADANATASAGVDRAAPASVALRLQAIRNSVSDVMKEVAKDPDDPTADREVQLAYWGNGWHHGWGGWGNGGWGNGWHNGWHNAGWGNGGWGNGGWGNGGLLAPLGALLGAPWGNWHNGFRNW